MELKFVLPPDGFKRLFYDIETSQALTTVFQVGRKVSVGHDDIIMNPAIICVCWKWEGIDEVHSVEWNEGCDKAALSTFIDVLMMADEVIGHNADNFDEKWIRTQAMMHGVPMPPRLPSLDTLKKMRSHFRLQSNRLDYVGRIMFGEGKSPMSKQDWHDILIPIIPKRFGYNVNLPDSYRIALDKMVEYCKKDVRLLEDVFHKIQPYVEHNHHAGAHTGHGRFSCPKCGDESATHQKKRMTKSGILKHQLQCKSCFSYFTISNKVWEQRLENDWKKSQVQ